MNDAINERGLVERCRLGDEGAFQELIDRYKELVFALIARTVQDRSRAEDLAQEVFLRIHRGLPYFRGEARLSTWIYRIVVNVCAQPQSSAAQLVSLQDERTPTRTAPGALDRRFGDIELRDRLVGEGMVDARDIDLMRVIDDPDAIVEAIFDFYENRGFQPTQQERERMLNL